jgi:hypothetical protein
MNHLIGQEFEQATIFEPGYLSGYRQSEITHLRFCTGRDEWRKEHFVVEFMYRGKRKKQLLPVAGCVILKGWGHPKLEWGIEETSPSGEVLSTRSKHPFGSPELEALLDDYLKALPPSVDVVLDGRTEGRLPPQPTPARSGPPEQDETEGDASVPGEVISCPDEVGTSAGLTEGAVQGVLVNRYERNPEARQECLSHHGYVCQCCLVDMESVYGELGCHYIHVHHKVPLADIGEDYQVDPINDLVPVCPNCHAMLHRPATVLAVEELRIIIQNIRQQPH